MTDEKKPLTVEEITQKLESLDSALKSKFLDNVEIQYPNRIQKVSSLRDELPSRSPVVTYVDGKMKIGDSPLVTQTLERIKQREARQQDDRPPIPADVLFARESRLDTFNRIGKLPLTESIVETPKVHWDRDLTIRGLFRIQDWRTRWNAFKLGCTKLWFKMTFRWE